MRFAIIAVAAALVGSACTGCSSHATSASRSPAATAEPTGHLAPQSAPVYPGATRKAVDKTATVSTYVTKDPFARVYAWYRNVLPPGSEQSHSLAPPQSSFFIIGDPGDQQAIRIFATGKNTTVVIALKKI